MLLVLRLTSRRLQLLRFQVAPVWRLRPAEQPMKRLTLQEWGICHNLRQGQEGCPHQKGIRRGFGLRQSVKQSVRNRGINVQLVVGQLLMLPTLEDITLSATQMGGRQVQRTMRKFA
jgi:hypothetical protein